LEESGQSQPDEEITLNGPESADVDTKLDLVTAYVDMGDAEGARDLLEEVLREGGPKQREQAKKLLDSLS
jgi:pilus assembly protein FimV